MPNLTYEDLIYQEHINTVLDLIPDGKIKFSIDGEKTNPMIVSLTVEFTSIKQLYDFRSQVAPYVVHIR